MAKGGGADVFAASGSANAGSVCAGAKAGSGGAIGSEAVTEVAGRASRTSSRQQPPVFSAVVVRQRGHAAPTCVMPRMHTERARPEAGRPASIPSSARAVAAERAIDARRRRDFVRTLMALLRCRTDRRDSTPIIGALAGVCEPSRRVGAAPGSGRDYRAT
jgi:hypothetical protein